MKINRNDCYKIVGPWSAISATDWKIIGRNPEGLLHVESAELETHLWCSADQLARCG